jgi:hypothetical protein
MEEKDGVVVVHVETHWRNAAPLLANASKVGVEMWSPKTASARSESTTRKRTLGDFRREPPMWVDRL